MNHLTLAPPAPALRPALAAVPAPAPVPSIGGGADLMGVKLSGTLPGGDRNGLDVLHGDLVRNADESHFVIAVIDCGRTAIDHGATGDTYTPIARLLYIEAVRDADDIATLEDIIGRIRAERVGGGTITFDLGQATLHAVDEDER